MAEAGEPDIRRISVLVDLLVAGGAERVAVDLAGGLARDRYSPRLIVTRRTGPLEDLARRLSVPVTILDRRWGFAPRKLARAVTTVRSTELLHAHKFAGGCWGVLIALLARRPVVVHEHSAYGGRRSVARTLLYRHWIGRRARAVVCVSDDVAAALRREGVRPDLLVVVPNGVSLPDNDRAGARRELGLGDGEAVVGIIGRLRVEKRHDLLLHAAAALRREGRSFRLCVVGDGPLAGELHRLAGELDLEGTVVWAGECADASRLAPAFDVGVLCSDFEGLPLAALEVLAAGVPLVATEVGALPALLRDGPGLVVPRGDAGALAAAIATLLDDEPRRRELGARGRALVDATYSVERACRQVEELYERVLSSGRGAGGARSCG